MRVPQSPHNLRKFVSSSPCSESDSGSDSEKMAVKKQELRHFSSHHRSRDRTRISAVQRRVERKLAQKEKDREKERNSMLKRSSSVGSQQNHDHQHPGGSLIRSLSRDRFADNAGKTYITISSGKPAQIRESSPTKRDILQSGTPLKTTKILKELWKEDDEEPAPCVEPQQRKISFTTEKTIQIQAPSSAKMEQKMRKISIDINYVYEQDHGIPMTKVIKDDKFVENEKRRLSLEKKVQDRQRSSSVSSMSTTSSESSFEASSSNINMRSTPEPVPRQSKQRKVSSSSQVRNINIILEDEISADQGSAINYLNHQRIHQKPKTSFHRRFSQDHSTNVKNLPPTFQARKISLQDTSTINTDR